MAFGVPTQTDNKVVNSLTRNGSAQVAQMTNNRGEVEEVTTYGATIQQTREFYLRTGETYSNGATNGQTAAAGNANGVVTASNYTASESDYERVSETREIIPAITGA